MKRFGHLIIIVLVFFACEKENEEETTPSFDYGEVSDIDGNVYRTIQIGEQTWMVDNLKTKHLNNGDEITYITVENRDAWDTLTTPACCWYDLTPKYADSLRNDGMFYNWYSVENNNVCPDGWRVPNDDDWNELFDYAETHGASDRKAAEKLKATEGWAISFNAGKTLNGTNEFGFEAKGTGYYKKNQNGWWSEAAGNYAYWWSMDTTIVDEMVISHEDRSIYDYANTFSMGYVDDTRNTSKNVHKWYQGYNYKKNGYSIRCIKE